MSLVSDRILVTGATGLLGSHLVAALHAAGHEVIALSRDPERARTRLPSIRAAFATPAEALASAPSAVVHLAGESVAGRWTEGRKRAIASSRIDGTRALVDAIAALPAQSRPRVLVSASAIGWYGDTGEREAREGDPPADDFLAQVCVGWEREASRAEALGVRVVCLRLGLVLARDGGALARMLPIFRLGGGGPIGTGRQWWSWIHVADVVDFVIHAIVRDDLRGALNATAPGVVRQRDFATALGRTLGRPAILPTPAFAVRVALGEFAVEVLASRRVVPARALEIGHRFRFVEIEHALRDLLA